MTAICLADFFNLDLWSRGRDPNYADIRAGLEELVATTVSALSASRHSVRDVNIRLYGGWYGDRVTDRVPMRELTAAVLREFPSRFGVRIRIELAETPIWDRSLRLLRTLRVSRIKPTGAKVTCPEACGDVNACAVPALASWLKGRCPTPKCEAKLADLGSTKRQKMVDTLIIADAITITRERTFDVLLIAGDDDDLMPAFLAAGAAELPTVRVRRKTGLNSYYDGILQLQGVTTYTW